MVVQEKLYTAEEFWEIASQPENDGRRLELDEGVIVEMAPSSQENTVIAARLIYFLSAHILAKGLGYVTAPDGGFKLGASKARQPDAAFLSKARHAELGDSVFPVAPDLAVEVVSPNEDVFKKVNEYLRAGTHLVWVVYPDEMTVYVCRLDDEGNLRSHPVGVEGILDGGDVLPGFTLPVRDIFPQ